MLLGCDIKNRTYDNGDKDNYSVECIIVHCATNYNANKNLTLNRRLTIERDKYAENIVDYSEQSSDFCSVIETIKANSSIFEETNLNFPPSTIVSYLNLSFDAKNSAWVDKSGNTIILCNNSGYYRYSDNIGGTIYIKKDIFEKIEKELGIYYYIFTEKLSHETGYYSNNSDMHIIIKNKRICKVCKNGDYIESTIHKKHKRCSRCQIYNMYTLSQETEKNSSPDSGHYSIRICNDLDDTDKTVL